MIQMLARRWWMLLVRGLAAIVFGILTFISPGTSLFVLVVLYGAWAIIDGAFNLGSSIRSAREGRSWGWLMFEGLIGIAAGVLTFLWPGISALALLFVIAGWMIVTGVAEISAAVRLRKYVRGEWALALAGVLSVVAGALLAIFPGAGALALAFWIGAYAVAFGLLMLVLALRLRSWGRAPEHRLPTGAVPV